MNSKYWTTFSKLMDENPHEKKAFKVLCGLAIVGAVSIVLDTLATVGLVVWWTLG